MIGRQKAKKRPMSTNLPFKKEKVFRYSNHKCFFCECFQLELSDPFIPSPTNHSWFFNTGSSSSYQPENHFFANMSGYGSSAEAGCCRCCCSFIFTSGFTALFLWLSLRGSNPKCSIEDFYLPSLNATNNSTFARSNHTIYFHLRLKNEMKDKGVGYNDINITFFYGPNNSLPIGNYTVPRFYQGHSKKAHRIGSVETHGVPWEAAYTTVNNGSTVTFRVGLTTRVRYKILFWYTKRHGLTVGANVDVNNSGKKVNKKGITLKSSAPEHIRYPAFLGFSFVLYFLVLLL